MISAAEMDPPVTGLNGAERMAGETLLREPSRICGAWALRVDIADEALPLTGDTGVGALETGGVGPRDVHLPSLRAPLELVAGKLAG